MPFPMTAIALTKRIWNVSGESGVHRQATVSVSQPRCIVFRDHQTDHKVVGMTEGRGKLFCVVGFKCWRSDIFVQRQNGEFVEPLKEMDIVVVEADRGTDLGTILFATNSSYKAERYCHILNTRHVREIVRSSINFSHYWRQVVPQMPTASAALEQGHTDTKQVRRKAAMQTSSCDSHLLA